MGIIYTLNYRKTNMPNVEEGRQKGWRVSTVYGLLRWNVKGSEQDHCKHCKKSWDMEEDKKRQ